MTKHCSQCRMTKPIEEFSRLTKAKDGRQLYCKECFKARYRQTATRHKQLVADRRKRTRREYQQRMASYFGNHPCVDCGETDLVVLEFDHVGKDKIANVCVLMQRLHAWNKIEQEIEKCDVVCANCHKRRTYSRCNSWRMGV